LIPGERIAVRGGTPKRRLRYQKKKKVFRTEGREKEASGPKDSERSSQRENPMGGKVLRGGEKTGNMRRVGTKKKKVNKKKPEYCERSIKKAKLNGRRLFSASKGKRDPASSLARNLKTERGKKG